MYMVATPKLLDSDDLKIFDEFFTVFYLSFLCGQLLKLEELNES